MSKYKCRVKIQFQCNINVKYIKENRGEKEERTIEERKYHGDI